MVPVVYPLLLAKAQEPFMSLGGPRYDARVWCLGRVPKHRNQWQELEGLLFSPKKISAGAYFELSFLGCGFLIHLYNRSDSPRFRAPRHQTRAPWLAPPRLKKAKSNFFTNRNILHTLKNEPLNIMLLHTSRRMDGSRGLVI